MSHTSDDEQDSPISYHPKSRSTSSNVISNFDDAFSDNDENDVSFEFSPATFRAEIAKNLSNASGEVAWNPDDDLGNLAAKIGFADPELSTPTFIVGSRETDDEQLSPPTQQPSSSGSQSPSFLRQAESFDDISLTSDFSSVSLSSPHPDSPHEEEEREEREHEEEQDSQAHSYPAVQIDASEDHPEPTVVRVETPTVDTMRSRSLSIPSHDGSPAHPTDVPLPATPQSANSVSSSSSLPMTATTPTPTSSHIRQASASNPSFPKHRTTRSVGPSMLDKVVSKTRPTYLPPKPRTEDRKHMADWESMMKHSRVAGEFD